MSPQTPFARNGGAAVGQCRSSGFLPATNLLLSITRPLLPAKRKRELCSRRAEGEAPWPA